jgi:hydrocephalus-inducing protein
MKPKKVENVTLSANSVNLGVNDVRIIEAVIVPSSIGAFEFQIEANVRLGNSLKFKIEGFCGLPTIKAASEIIFGRCLPNFSKTRSISIINTSLLPAHIRIDFLKSVKEFSVNLDSSIIILPQREKAIDITFSPMLSSKRVSTIFTIVCEDNPKSNVSVACHGEAVPDEVVLEGFESELSLRDTIAGKSNAASFTMRNLSSCDFRFSWQDHPDLRVFPRVGHLQKLKSKTINVTFLSEKIYKLGSIVSLRCALVKISYIHPDPPDWDELNPVKNPATPRASATMKRGRRSVSFSSRLSMNAPVDDGTKPEPEYAQLPEKVKDVVLPISVSCDSVKAALSERQVVFGPTMMLSKDGAIVTMKNLSFIRLSYCWTERSFDCCACMDFGTPFGISPVKGEIEADGSCDFLITFAPKEVDDFRSVFKCNVSGIQDFLTLEMIGYSKRPICHIDIEPSSYLNRRFPEYNSTLPDGVKVFELTTNALGMLTRAKFAVVNTTRSSYEVMWKEVKGDHSIMCENDRKFVAAGQKFMVEFAYLPTTAVHIETLWSFEIPSQNVRVPFLIVGRVMKVLHV